MKRLVLSLIVGNIVLSNVAVADIKQSSKKIVVAVIDTGIDSDLLTDQSLCPSGHKDFTNSGLVDRHGHGTHISGIIDQYAKNFLVLKDGAPSRLKKVSANYCQIIIKYYDPSVQLDALKSTVSAFRWAIDHNVDIINYSSGGNYFSKEEHDVVVEALNKGIKIVAAAGNEGSDIDKHKYYPAMYDKRIYIVGNLVTANSQTRLPSSNYGNSVNVWEPGTDILSRLPNGKFGFMSGTSQATAVKTGKLVRSLMTSR